MRMIVYSDDNLLFTPADGVQEFHSPGNYYTFTTTNIMFNSVEIR